MKGTPAKRDSADAQPPAAVGEHMPPWTRLRVTTPEAWGFFLLVIVGIVAGCCVECVEAIQAIADTFPWHRDQ